jgi:hypothetical protein
MKHELEEIRSTFECKCGVYVGWISDGEEKECINCHTKYKGVYDEKQDKVKAVEIVRG